jgi:Fe-S-cluster containining protein
MNSYTIDLPFIAQEALDKEEENVAFRSFLKNLDMPSSELDNIVHDIYDVVSSQIDCTKCANCCKLIQPLFSHKDISSFAAGLQVTPSIFADTHLVPSEDKPGKFEFNVQPCPFLTDNLCANYAARPRSCSSFPFLDKKDFRSRLWGVLFNYELCPIVYHVYEELKQELWNVNEFEEDNPFDNIWLLSDE